MPNLCLYYRQGRCICPKKCLNGELVNGKRLCKACGMLKAEKTSEPK